MKNVLHKAADIICILLEIGFAIISLPFKILKAVFDIIEIIGKTPACAKKR